MEKKYHFSMEEAQSILAEKSGVKPEEINISKYDGLVGFAAVLGLFIGFLVGFSLF